MREKAKKKVKKRYVPKPILPDPVNYVVTGMLPLETAEEEVRKLRCANHGALTDIVTGVGTKASAVLLRNMLITTESLAQMGVGKECLPEIHAAQHAVDALILRGHKTGRHVFTGPELNAVNLAMAMHEDQIGCITLKTFEDAIIRARKLRGLK